MGRSARKRLEEAAAVLSRSSSNESGVEKATFTHFLRWRLVGEAAQIYPISSVDASRASNSSSSNGGEEPEPESEPELTIRGYRIDLNAEGTDVCRVTSTALVIDAAALLLLLSLYMMHGCIPKTTTKGNSVCVCVCA